jgi:hypothetical protein
MSKYVMHCDIEFSRRKSLHHIMNGEGEVVWSGKGTLAAFGYLADEGVYEFRVEGKNTMPGFQVMIHRD